ncbi:MAG TPA: hypothetical protein VI076_15615 [Actinopolymorphaceae bacterium]
MGATKRHDTGTIRRVAAQLRDSRDSVNALGETMPESIDGSILGEPIAEHVESVVANLAALVTGLDEAANEALRAARLYDRTEAENVEISDRILRDLLDGPDERR